ncbi:MAG: tryptophan 7-halogenase [Hellea sp.]|nr:tryptophan 7-halogenase [Hellea sp.]
MTQTRVKDVVIVGGGTAGWITASMLVKFLGPVINIHLIESEKIGRVGVGEATIPPILRLNRLFNINEDEMMSACGATVKLGIKFDNWGHKGESYLHGFGHNGVHLNNLQFHHYWLRAKELGIDADYWDFSPNWQASKAHKFAHNVRGKNGLSDLIYAYHFDALLFAGFLRKFAEKLGVKRTEGIVTNVNLNAEDGFIKSVSMESGEEIKGDLFVDCTGFRSLLLGEALGVPYVDWSKWLPCNRAVACGSSRVEPLPPYTRAAAHDAGWQWTIPLQHRNGEGHVYCSDFMEADEAEKILRDNVAGDFIGPANHIKFTTGHRKEFWHKNCVGIGLSSGFLEPLESTSIHLIQRFAGKLVDQFPAWPIQDGLRKEFNRQTLHEFGLIRDFLVLHYHRTDREDTEFWKYCKHMEIPETLSDKMELFQSSAKLRWDPEDVFADPSWAQVMIGQGMMPDQYQTRATAMNKTQLEQFFAQMRQMIESTLKDVPSHSDYINRYCQTDIS